MTESVMWDVIVVGAGPAGSSAAYDLVQAGKKVLLIDKADFPRDKPCGGGLTPKTLNLLRFDVGSVIERACTRMVLTNKLNDHAELPEVGVLCSMVQRPQFDMLLRDKALAAGALFQVAQVQDIAQKGHEIHVHTIGGGYASRPLADCGRWR